MYHHRQQRGSLFLINWKNQEVYFLEKEPFFLYAGDRFDRKEGFPMFADSLSDSLLRICHDQGLTYEQAAERCGCSSRYFGSIVRQEASPSLRIFEQICQGFGQSPNQMLGVEEEALAYRMPMAVWALLPCGVSGQFLTLPACPRCGGSLERGQAYCACCGQRLDWSGFDKASQRK